MKLTLIAATLALGIGLFSMVVAAPNQPDLDAIGVRKDIAQFLTQSVGKSPELLQAAMAAARAKQHLLDIDANNKAEVSKAVREEVAASSCLVDKFPGNPAQAVQLNNALNVRTFNSSQRKRQVTKVYATMGQFTGSASTPCN